MRSTRSELRPALFAGYRDLTALRYDFPLVLMSKGGDQTGAIAVRLCSTARSKKSRRTMMANACASMPAGSNGKFAS